MDKIFSIFIVFLLLMMPWHAWANDCDDTKAELLSFQRDQYATQLNCPTAPADLSRMPPESEQRLQCLSLAELQKEHDQLLAQQNLVRGLDSIRTRLQESVGQFQNQLRRTKFLEQPSRDKVKTFAPIIANIKNQMGLLQASQTLAQAQFKVMDGFFPTSATADTTVGLHYQYGQMLLHVGGLDFFNRSGLPGMNFQRYLKEYCQKQQEEISRNTAWAQSVPANQRQMCEYVAGKNLNSQELLSLNNFSYEVLDPYISLDLPRSLTTAEDRYREGGPILANRIQALTSAWSTDVQTLVSKFEEHQNLLNTTPNCAGDQSSSENCRKLEELRVTLSTLPAKVLTELEKPLGQEANGPGGEELARYMESLRTRLKPQLQNIKTEMEQLAAVPTQQSNTQAINFLKEKMTSELVPQWKLGLERELKNTTLEGQAIKSTSSSCKSLFEAAQTAPTQRPPTVDELGAQNPARNASCRSEDPAAMAKFEQNLHARKDLFDRKASADNEQTKKIAATLKDLQLCPDLSDYSSDDKIAEGLQTCLNQDDFDGHKRMLQTELEGKLARRQEAIRRIKNQSEYRVLERMKMLAYSAMKRVCTRLVSAPIYEGGCPLLPAQQDMQNLHYLTDEAGKVLGVLAAESMDQDYRDLCNEETRGERLVSTCNLHEGWYQQRLSEDRRRQDEADYLVWRKERREYRARRIARRLERMRDSYYDWRTGSREEFHTGRSIFEGAVAGIGEFAASGIPTNLANLYGQHQMLYAQASAEVEFQRLQAQQQQWMIANGIYPYGPVGAPLPYYPGGVPSVGGYPMLLPRDPLTPNPALLSAGGRPDLFTSGQNFQFNQACFQGLAVC